MPLTPHAYPDERNDLLTINPADPAVGQHSVTVIPAGQVWRILSVTCLLETSGVAGDRNIGVGILSEAGVDGGQRILLPFTQAANLSVQVFLAHGISPYSVSLATQDYAQGPLPCQYEVKGGDTFTVLIFERDAGDQLLGVFIRYKLWLES